MSRKILLDSFFVELHYFASFHGKKPPHELQPRCRAIRPAPRPLPRLRPDPRELVDSVPGMRIDLPAGAEALSGGPVTPISESLRKADPAFAMMVEMCHSLESIIDSYRLLLQMERERCARFEADVTTLRARLASSRQTA
jgi:hypothetical protein